LIRKDDIYYMKKALQQAEIASESGEVPVGAVVALEDGREFVAHNAPVSLHDATAHAEIRAIRAACAATGNYRLSGSTLYVTIEPCLMCAGAIIHARIVRLVYAAADPKTGGVESLYQALSDTRLNHQPAVTSGILAHESAVLLKTFFRQRRQRQSGVTST